MNKEEIRLSMRAARRALTQELVSEMSGRIAAALFSLDVFKEAKTVCAYMSSFKEPETRGIISELLRRGVRVAVPITHTDTGLLSLSYIDDADAVQKGAYGIYEPAAVKRADICDMNAVLVPGLAFDRGGGRMGFGKGYYDRLLNGSNAVKIGLCYGFQLADALPLEEHDVRMDFIITEREIIKAGDV